MLVPSEKEEGPQLLLVEADHRAPAALPVPQLEVVPWGPEAVPQEVEPVRPPWLDAAAPLSLGVAPPRPMEVPWGGAAGPRQMAGPQGLQGDPWDRFRWDQIQLGVPPMAAQGSVTPAGWRVPRPVTQLAQVARARQERYPGYWVHWLVPWAHVLPEHLPSHNSW